MKNKNDKKHTLELFIVVGTIFVIFILIISSGENTRRMNFLDITKLKLSNIFYPKIDIDLDDYETHLSIEVQDEGYDVYVPNRVGYRYGPSIIYYEDGTMDAWFASNGNSSEWDWITYRHYDGNVWSSEEIVLRPTPGSKDHYSTCDPGVIYFNEYYYLGYTSTENSKNGGVENCAYVARSKNPNGPYEKWNGTGWGGDPQPIIIYDGYDSQWGAGELSFVVLDDRLFCYYSWINSDGSYTKLSKADLVDDWPLTLQERGTVLNKTNGQDSVDVIYVEEYEKFLAFCVEARFLDNSCIAVYESDNGKKFEQVDRVITNIHSYSHNMGISKKPDGHVGFNDDLIIGYAYGNSAFNTWGKWSTKFQHVNLKVLVNGK